MKKLTLLFTSLFAFLTMFAGEVTEAEALQKAQQFMQGKQFKQRNLRRAASKDAKNNAYYVFNVEDNGGFVIVSGSNNTEEILGYSDNGVFRFENMPENLRSWLDGYAEEIQWIEQQTANSSQSGNQSQVALLQSRNAISPLLTTTWNQSDPYNLKTPVFDGRHAPTGCGATAIAQILYYHKWPTDYTEQFDDLPPIKFDWANMKKSYSGSETTNQKTAVANLMLYCGHACSTKYHASSSGSNYIDYPEALTRLSFATTLKFRSRKLYPLDQWENLIYNELAAKRPVIYSAQQEYEADWSGHAFVCDGYDGNGLYHINWGWGGLGNGYFRLQALNPYKDVGYSLGYGGYTQNQVAIVGISPHEIDEVDHYSCLFVDWLYLDGGKVTDDNGAKIANYDKNKGFSDFRVCYRFGMNIEYLQYYKGKYDVGLGLYKNGQLIDAKEIESAVESSWLYSWWYLDGLGKNLSDGTYQLKGIGRWWGSLEWIKNIDADNNFITFEIKNGKVVGRNIGIGTNQYRMLSVEQVFDDGNNNPAVKILRATFRNNNEVENSPALYLYVDGKNMNCEQAYIPKGETDYMDFVFKTNNGYHQILITSGEYESTGNNTLYLNHQFYLGDQPNGSSDPTKKGVIRVTPPALNFESVIYGQSKTKKISVTNVGDVNLTFHVSESGPFHVSDANNSFTIAPTENRQFEVTFSPTTGLGEVEGAVNIYSNASNGMQFVQLNGIGYNYTPPEAVDLALPSGTKWASFNVGATKPEEYGDYFAWGETEPKISYEENNYLYYNSSNNTYQDIGESICGTKYDVAHVEWGGNWKMPSRDQIEELIDNCTLVETQVNGVNGTKFVSKNNGKDIFLPAAGSYEGSNLQNYKGSSGNYWSGSTVDGSVLYLGFFYTSAHLYWGGIRCNGFTVRPVSNNNEILPIGVLIVSDEADGDSPFYSLDGQRINGQPTKRGVYVRDGKKVVVR